MSITIGFSSSQVYGLLGTTNTHNSDSFIVFIRNSIDFRVNKLKLGWSKFIFVWDNSSIHKIQDVKSFIEG